ncbi:hypothetical protein N7454_001058 [Penicillium verhagenii]|nr:hypothetical protein N7454_001058 [Penicillium verhagenii]
MLTRESLSAFLDISRDPNFGPLIHRISISTDHLVSAEVVANPVSAATVQKPFWHSYPQGVSPADGYKDYLADQEKFHKLGQDTIFLAQALQSATNCRELIIDGQNKPWGAQIVKEKTGYYPPTTTDENEGYIHVQRAVHVVMAALAASNTQIEYLEFYSCWRSKHLIPAMLSLPESCLNPTLSWAKSLKSLMMTLDVNEGQDPEKWAKPLAQFVMIFPGLTDLSFRFPDRVPEDSFLAALSGHLKLPSIQNFHIEKLDCDPDLLLSLVHGLHPEELYLEEVGLETAGGWQSFLARARDELDLSYFLMEDCQEEGEEICFGEGDRDIAKRVVLEREGSDPSLPWNRLINGIRRTPDEEHAGKPYRIR